MRSALAGTANKVVAVKTTAAVPMSVIERMVHLLCGVDNNDARSHAVPRKQYLITQTFIGFLAEHFESSTQSRPLMLDTSNKRSTVIADHFVSKCVFPENVEAKPCHASNRREKKNLQPTCRTKTNPTWGKKRLESRRKKLPSSPAWVRNQPSLRKAIRDRGQSHGRPLVGPPIQRRYRMRTII